MTDALVPETAPLSQGERVLDTFVAPSKTFRDVLRSRSWWLPFTIIVLISYVLSFGISHKVGWENLVDNEIHANPSSEERFQNASPQQQAMQKKMMTYSFKGAFYAAPLTNLAFVALFAVVLWGTINFAFGGKSSFSEVFCVMNYAYLPLCIKSLVAVLLLYVGSSAETFTMDTMVGSSPGYFIDTPGALKTFLTSFDVFQLWSMVLMSIGIAIVARTKRVNGYIVVFGWWALIVLIKTGAAAVMG